MPELEIGDVYRFINGEDSDLDYRIMEKLGTGGSGQVYKAFALIEGQRIIRAIKVCQGIITEKTDTLFPAFISKHFEYIFTIRSIHYPPV